MLTISRILSFYLFFFASIISSLFSNRTCRERWWPEGWLNWVLRLPGLQWSQPWYWCHQDLSHRWQSSSEPSSWSCQTWSWAALVLTGCSQDWQMEQSSPWSSSSAPSLSCYQMFDRHSWWWSSREPRPEWKDDQMIRLLDDVMQGWQDDEMTEWQNDRMTWWWDD